VFDVLQIGIPASLWLLYRSRANLPSLFHDRNFPRVVAIVFWGLGALRAARYAVRELPQVEAWESDAIARAIAAGHGFSFPGWIRWLWDMPSQDPNAYFPTAWEDPVYTYVLAGMHALFHDQAFLAAYALNFICIAIVAYLVYRIASRFAGAWTGAIAVVLLSAHTELYVSFFANITATAFATCVVTGCALAAVRYFESPTRRRIVVLGLVTGFTVLSSPAAVYFAYALVAALVLYHGSALRTGIVRAGAFLLAAALVVLPWSLRNYETFGTFVLVRTGAGEIAYTSTVATAATFMPGVARSPTPVPWTSTGPKAAITEQLQDRDKRIALSQFEFDVFEQAPPPGYAEMNEAQRDAIHLERAKEFVVEHPIVAAEMAIVKWEVLATSFGVYGLALLALAVLGAALAIKDRRSWPPTLLVGTTSLIFLLIIPYYPRYRSPIDPSLVVLAAVALRVLDARLRNAFDGRPMRIALGRRTADRAVGYPARYPQANAGRMSRE
jgi:4-amino-4-deoxy-L-arabinose transferase-like glycosyltransferase